MDRISEDVMVGKDVKLGDNITIRRGGIIKDNVVNRGQCIY